MKKSLFIILMVCLALVGLVSCKNEIEPAQEELIYVSFENGISRALTATLEDFDVDDFYWSYEAQKNDGSGLKSGETATWNETGAGSVIVQTGKGLNYGGTTDPVKVPGFSKGYWNFRLFAYTDAARTKLAYWGEADSVLIDSSHHLASVTVSPVSGADGYLRIGTITFVPASGISVPTDLVIYTDEVFELVEEQWKPVTVLPVEGVYTLLAGQYKFTRTYSFDGIPVSNGSVIVTIYSNLTTTVSGSLSELTTYAEFEGKQNPDIVRETWGTTTIDEDTTGTINFAKNLDPAATDKVASATMPAAAAVAKLAELEELVGADDNSSSTLKLNLSVDTTDVKQQSVTYDIGMEAVLTYTKNQTQSVAKSDVKNVDDYVIVVIDIDSDISDVSVTHSGVAMIKFADSEAGYAAFLAADTDDDELVPATATSEAFYKGFYCLRTDGETKTLNIKTRSFSPFEVTYAMTTYVAAIGNVKYTTLTAAIAAAKAGDTIIILDNITTDDGYLINKNLSIDTHGYTITVNEGSNINNRAFKVTSGKLSVYGGGTIDAKGTSSTGCYGAFRAEIGTELYLEGITLKNYRINGLNVKVLGAYAELKNVSITSIYGGGIEVTDDDGAAGTVRGYAKLTGCTMTQSQYGDWCSTPVTVSGNSTVDVYSTSYTGEYGVYVFSSGGTINIYGGVFTASDDPVLKTSYDSKYGNDAIINVYDGTFNGTFGIGNSGHEFLNITGGTFDHDPTAYVLRGYKVDIVDNKYVVSKRTEGVASIIDGEEELFFDTLQHAIDAAYDGETIILHADILSSEQRSSTNGSFAIKKSLTFEGKKSETENYKVYSGNGESFRVFSIDENENDITVTFKNMDIVGPTSGGYTRGISIWNNTGKIVVNLIGSKVSANYYSINVASKNTGGVDINITDSSCSAGWSAVQMWSKANVNCSNSILIGTNDKTYNAEGWNNYATVVIYGEAYDSDATADESILHFNNCDLVGIATTGNKQWVVDYRALIETYYSGSRFWIGTTAFDGSFDNLTLVDLSTEEAFIENWHKCLVFRTNESCESVIDIE